MSHGRITRASRRYPDAKRRAARYGRTRYGRRATSLPPHLLPGATGREKKTGPVTITRALFVAGAVFIAVSISFIILTVVSGVAGAYGTVRAYRDVNKKLPNAAEVNAKTFQTTRLYDRNGTLLQEVDNPNYGWRTFVPYEQIAPDLINATISAEDSTFWTNDGVEPIAIIRGGFINFSGSGSSGGSTITQQLVRALYPDQISALDISYTRKIREALAAIALAKKYSKKDIITMYVNQIYYGARSYGIEAASETYFNKHAKDLTLAEASMLAGLPQSPSYYEPDIPDNFPIAKRRQQYVLDQMVKYRYITREQADAAFNEPLHPKNDRNGAVLNAPHFTQYVKDYITEKFGEDALYGGLEITTTVDLPLQQEAEQIVATGVANMAQYERNNGAAVVISPWNGAILAMVGSADFNDALIDGQVNFATSQIQPGSSMKPIVYSAAFERGWNPATVLLDVPTTWKSPGQPDYTPQNDLAQFYGAVSVRIALNNSLNIPAVKTADFLGVQTVIDQAHKMGIKSSLNDGAGFYGLSIALGAGEVTLLEHTNVYATLSNNGAYVPANPILQIKDSQGNVLYKLDEAQVEKTRTQAVPAGNAYQISSILTDNDSRKLVWGLDNLFGNTQKALGRPCAVKSGTTENWKDLWTMGYTTAAAIGVWVGRSGDTSDTSLPEIDGVVAAGPIWQNLMEKIHGSSSYMKLLVGSDGKEVAHDFPVPTTATKISMCSATGNKAASSQNVQDWAVKGQEPTLACGDLSDYQKTQLDAALKAIQSGNASWAPGAISSIQNYARVASGGSSSSSSQPITSTNSNGSGSGNSGNGTTSSNPPSSTGGDNTRNNSNSSSDSDSNPSQVIEPTDNGDGGN